MSIGTSAFTDPGYRAFITEWVESDESYSGDLAQIRVNEFLREAERIAVVSKALHERKATRRERTARAALRPLRLARVLASAAVAALRS